MSFSYSKKYILPTCAFLAFLTAGSFLLKAQQVEFHPQDGFSITYATEPETYLVLMRGAELQAIDTPVSIILPKATDSAVKLDDPQVYSRSFYQVHQYSNASPVDSDGDGIDDFFELQHPLLLDALNPADAGEDADGDGSSNLAEYNGNTNPDDTKETIVSFTTSDDISITGTLRVPAARDGTQFPAVVLIHQGFSSRNEWTPYDDAMNDAGYITLSYDIRGHGQSGGTFSAADFNNPNTTPKDLQAAIAFLNAHAMVDAERIGVVGASVGGNLACVASQKRWVKTAVNLSGKTSAALNLTGDVALDLTSMFHISSSGDGGGSRALWANELYQATTEPRQVEIVNGSSAHGVAIFNSDPTLLSRVVAWLNETL